MDEKVKSPGWLTAIKARGWSQRAQTALDMIEPIAPLATQVLWVIQPFSTIVGGRQAVHELAELLDTPEGIARLRQQLDDD